MVMDLLDVEDGVITYNSTTGRGTEEKKALLNEADELWAELRYVRLLFLVRENELE